MTQEIEEIIKKHLPAQVGDVLKQTLAQAEKDAEKCKQLQCELEAKIKTNQALNETIEKYKANDDRNTKLEARETAVRDAERNQKIAELEYKLANEKEKTEFTKNVSLNLVRNTEYRKTIFDSENQVGYSGPNGTWIQPMPINKSLTEDNTAK